MFQYLPAFFIYLTSFLFGECLYYYAAYFTLLTYSNNAKTCCIRAFIIPLAFPVVFFRNLIAFSLEKFATQDKFERDETEDKQSAELTSEEVKIVIRVLEKYQRDG